MLRLGWIFVAAFPTDGGFLVSLPYGSGEPSAGSAWPSASGSTSSWPTTAPEPEWLR